MFKQNKLFLDSAENITTSNNETKVTATPTAADNSNTQKSTPKPKPTPKTTVKPKSTPKPTPKPKSTTKSGSNGVIKGSSVTMATVVMLLICYVVA